MTQSTDPSGIKCIRSIGPTQLAAPRAQRLMVGRCQSPQSSGDLRGMARFDMGVERVSFRITALVAGSHVPQSTARPRWCQSADNWQEIFTTNGQPGVLKQVECTHFNLSFGSTPPPQSTPIDPAKEAMLDRIITAYERAWE